MSAAVAAMLVPLAIWEGVWWGVRRGWRTTTFDRAALRAETLGRPLIVVGAPDAAVTAGYGCGDLTVDIDGSEECPASAEIDICKFRSIPAPDDSAVVFVSCVLEYVEDHGAAVAELLRVAGSPENLFVVRVEPWTLTSVFYPGAKRVVSSDGLREVWVKGRRAHHTRAHHTRMPR